MTFVFVVTVNTTDVRASYTGSMVGLWIGSVGRQVFISAGWPPIGDGRSISAVALVDGPSEWRYSVEGWPGLADLLGGPGRGGEVRREAI